MKMKIIAIIILEIIRSLYMFIDMMYNSLRNSEKKNIYIYI